MLMFQEGGQIETVKYSTNDYAGQIILSFVCSVPSVLQNGLVFNAMG